MENNKIKKFVHEMFGELRVTEENNKLYFVGKDIADILGYSNSSKAVLIHCKNSIKRMIAHSQNGKVVKTLTSLIPEGDLYRLIIKSKLPKAQEFEEWIMDVVLPALRKDGMYVQDEEKVVSGEMNEDELILKAMNLLSSKVERLQREKDELKNINSKITQENEDMKPIVTLAEKFANLNNCWDIGTYAKIIDVKNLGRNNMFKWMKDRKILMSDNLPYQNFNKYFKVLAVKNKYTGHTNYKPMLKPEGVTYIYKKLVKENKVVVKSIEEVIKELEHIA
ncbi:MAG: BRO family protein [Clostridium sp.]|uniref:BRO family protein n=1 Tax=Clostridium sp. TaxID=1506 RepID=UPI003F38019E